MTITTQQLQALEDGQVVELTIAGTRYVIVRQDVYERVNAIVETRPRQTYAAVLKALDNSDESPEQYLEYLNE